LKMRNEFFRAPREAGSPMRRRGRMKRGDRGDAVEKIKHLRMRRFFRAPREGGIERFDSHKKISKK
ncbi:MAG: hypothetical protein IIW31_01280, partial [Clostridia bacterium]|nr:hypothetical protein [Clostridia bacterium]